MAFLGSTGGRCLPRGLLGGSSAASAGACDEDGDGPVGSTLLAASSGVVVGPQAAAIDASLIEPAPLERSASRPSLGLVTVRLVYPKIESGERDRSRAFGLIGRG